MMRTRPRGRRSWRSMATRRQTKAPTGNRPHYHGHRKRLRERFLKAGFAGFAEHEVLELLLTLAIPRRDTKPAAKALLARFGSLRGVLDAPIGELRSVAGVGEVAAVSLAVVQGVAAVYLQQATEQAEPSQTTERLLDFWRLRIGSLMNEVFEVAFLDTAHRLLPDGVQRMQEGTVDRAAVYPRRIVEGALRRGAAAIVLAHNHPNGNVNPSERDKLITRAIVLAADTIELRVLDHVIVSSSTTFSFRNEGLL